MLGVQAAVVTFGVIGFGIDILGEGGGNKGIAPRTVTLTVELPFRLLGSLRALPKFRRRRAAL
jgi:hypothetical protein